MKRFLSAVVLCIALLAAGLFFFLPSAGAENNVLAGLLTLPAPPPPNPLFPITQNERDEKFYDKKNPPKDDASIEDLLAYWKYQNQFDPKYAYAIKPSEKSLDRLKAEIEKNPASLSELLGVMPEGRETADFVKKMYDDEVSKRDQESSWRTEAKKWLTYHSNYFSDELAQIANQAADTKEYVTNQDEVLALARVDWERAKPLLEKMLGSSNQPISQTLARWAFYQHALAVNDTLDISTYRKELQETVENKSLQPGNRDLAMDALIESGDYEGRDDWYYTLLDDETLYELKVNGQVYTGLTTILNHSPSDKYVDKMVELAGSGNATIRSAAVKNLATLIDTVKNPEIVRALLPWLENPKWAKENGTERAKLVMALRNYAMPESVPGLIAMLNEKERVEVEVPQNPNANVVVQSNRMPVPNSVTKTQIDTYPFRSAAIMALEKQKSSLAAAPLRQILPLVEQWERPNIVRTLLVSNGFSIPEQIEALEEFAKTINQPQIINDGANTANMAYNTMAPDVIRPVSNAAYNQPYNPNDLRIVLGQQLTSIEDVSEELVTAMIDRISSYDKKNPQLASALRQIVQNWKGPAINSLMLRDLKNGKTTLDAVVKLIILRKSLRENQLSEVGDIRGGTPTALGISACLLEETTYYDAILDGTDPEAKTAMLGCARLIRAQLPVQKVALNLKDPNKLLQLAAERYLEAEDSPEARQIVLSLHPNEAKILGARVSFAGGDEQSVPAYFAFVRELFMSVESSYQALPPYFFYGYSTAGLVDAEKKLQAEVKENKELLGIYAYDNNFVRIYQDRAVFSWTDNPARFRERTLSPEEFEGLKNFLIAQRVDELPPFLANCQNCEDKELLMIGRMGGRRVFVKADTMPPFFAELGNIFTEMRRQPAQIHYYLEKDVKGLEVLLADDNLKAQTIWKDGEDFRVLVDDTTLRKQTEKEIEETESPEVEGDGESEETDEKTTVEAARLERENEKLARQKEYASYAWYKFDKTKLLEPTVQPPLVEYIPLIDGFAVQPSEQQWKARAAGVEIRADNEGLYKISRGQIAKIRSGYYYDPLVTPNGRWAIATKYAGDQAEGDGDAYASSLVRVNLATNKEFKVKIETDYESLEPVAFLPALNKVLIFSGYGESEESEPAAGDREGVFFLLDPDTGIAQPLKGEAHPLLQQTFRPLQLLAASTDEFWAAVPDRAENATEFGVYNAKTLVFKPLLKISQIIFTSMDMWIDEKENKIYFAYEGQLLALPLPKKG
jgi:hypothetical protein